MKLIRYFLCLFLSLWRSRPIAPARCQCPLCVPSDREAVALALNAGMLVIATIRQGGGRQWTVAMVTRRPDIRWAYAVSQN